MRVNTKSPLQLSTNELARNNGALLYYEDCGYIIKPDSTSKFVAACGTYFLKMFVPKTYTRASPDDPAPAAGDFGRQG